MDKHVAELLKTGGAGSFGLIVVYLLMTLNSTMTDISKAVQDNDSRLDVVEYRLNAGG
ncbi:hypothetical protein [Shewanella subflava]|uniref:Uncharacterized protein n=1 Tax=Shewanella subflava TaxID=2986476 RepID=A0ABT3ICG1_9GAMM|nr:hypothetical protein [Shewanella subflava]MCW3173744.1 hypothetical protein [Shewanella subflava]